MALNGLFCADVPLRNYSLTLHTKTHKKLLKSFNTCKKTFKNLQPKNFFQKT